MVICLGQKPGAGNYNIHTTRAGTQQQRSARNLKDTAESDPPAKKKTETGPDDLPGVTLIVGIRMTNGHLAAMLQLASWHGEILW